MTLLRVLFIRSRVYVWALTVCRMLPGWQGPAGNKSANCGLSVWWLILPFDTRAN